MNLEAFQNLKRVLATVPADRLDMCDWDRCAIGHACRDRWFREEGLERHFGSIMSVFDISYFSAQQLFTSRAGSSPEQVIATIDRFILGEVPRDKHALRERRQGVIDHMLATALKAEKVARNVAVAVVAMFTV